MAVFSSSTSTSAAILRSCFFLALLALPLKADEIPATLRPAWPQLDFYPPSLPAWVSAEQAFGEDGRLVADLFRPEALQRLNDLLYRPKDPATGCTRMLWIEQEYVNPPDRSSLKAAIRSSQLIVLGKVVAREIGFERGELGQLLMIQPIERLKPNGGDLGRNYFVFVPAGRFQLGKLDICKEDPRVVLPEIGDEVLLFPRDAPAGEAFLNLEYEGSLVVFTADDQVRWPRSFTAESPEGGSQPGRLAILDEIRAEVGKARP